MSCRLCTRSLLGNFNNLPPYCFCWRSWVDARFSVLQLTRFLVFGEAGEVCFPSFSTLSSSVVLCWSCCDVWLSLILVCSNLAPLLSGHLWWFLVYIRWLHFWMIICCRCSLLAERRDAVRRIHREKWNNFNNPSQATKELWGSDCSCLLTKSDSYV